jgi:histidyl-tRNA synthetase
MASIDTNPASGTRDFLPDEVARREAAFAVIREVFSAYGFSPMDTPAFERLDVLMGKYGEEGDQLIFKILRRGEHEETGEADLALRYDLTVPMARFVARYGGELGEPFKRYAIAPVWRADRPGKGRFREFFQCDVDTVGSDSLVADAEVLLALTEVLDALGLTGFEVQLNSREALHGLIEAYGIPAELDGDTLVAIDKLDKIGVDGVAAELRERGLPPAAVEAMAADLGADDADDRLRDRIAAAERGRAGLAEVDTVLDLVRPNLAGGAVTFSPVLARGLSYYTGPIFEVRHTGLNASLAGGGRYDGLVGMFSNRDIPATGGSLGIERILLLLEEGGATGTAAPPVLVTVLDDALRADAVRLATRIRREGAIHADLYVSSGRLGKQFRYADRRGVRYAVIRGQDEIDAGTVGVKDLVTGDQVSVTEDELIPHLKRALDAAGGPSEDRPA